MRIRWYGCALALLALLADAAPADEATAVAALEKLGARIKRDDKLPGKPVVDVNLYRTGVVDADLQQLAVLKGLQTLNLMGTAVTDVGLKNLATLKGLRTLDILCVAKIIDANSADPDQGL